MLVYPSERLVLGVVFEQPRTRSCPSMKWTWLGGSVEKTMKSAGLIWSGKREQRINPIGNSSKKQKPCTKV